MSGDLGDEEVKAKLGQAYWLPLPLAYMTATGAVAIQWGQFEMQFVGFIRILARPPKLAPLAATIPRNFSNKGELLRRLARGAFPNCPTLVEKLYDFSIRANETGKKRNAILHGFWFDLTPFDPTKGVSLVTEPDGTGDIYSVTLTEIEALSIKIADLKTEGVFLTFEPGALVSERLTPDERSALQEHHKNFPAPTQQAPVHRDPNRKGSPTRPEPFQA